MRSQLDILALEPFYGGIRRAMLGAVMRCSRHRWTLLKLPPRRMERRLAAAANWFAEQLGRHFTGQFNVLFTSEAMNLANLYRLVPELASRPSVVYFHENHLPAVNARTGGPHELVNLNTAMAASEIWFNSVYHQHDFQARGTALVTRHPELMMRNPMQAIATKSHLVPPPLDLGYVSEVKLAFPQPVRRKDTIFVETRDADVKLLNWALEIVHQSGRKFRLITVGPVKQLSNEWERLTIREIDEPAQVVGMLESSVLVSVKPRATSDYLLVRGMLAGCRPVAPDDGVYPELIPPIFHGECLYRNNPTDLAAKISDALDAGGWTLAPPDWRKEFRSFDAISACRLIDERLEDLASQGTGS
ncbi:MAG TPA: DUF3524 domain-containing protein [Tepidisphaeraceae bacterium]|nr:DUF3524 domain-containing protein [Tepidisphaeraceae bacterium]